MAVLFAHQDWDTHSIKAELCRRHGSLSALAQSWGYDRSAISSMLRNPTRNKKIERQIAEELGVPLHVLWPGRWKPDGQPIPLLERVNRSAAAVAATTQKADAA